MEEGSSDEDEDEDEDDDTEQGATSGIKLGESAPTPMGKPLLSVDAAPAVKQPALSALPNPGQVEVRQYDPKKNVKKAAEPQKGMPEEFLISPITGNMSSHVFTEVHVP